MENVLRNSIVALVLIFVLGMFVVAFVPTMETNIVSTNITNDTTALFVDFLPWLPVVLILAAAIVGLIVYVFRSGFHSG